MTNQTEPDDTPNASTVDAPQPLPNDVVIEQIEEFPEREYQAYFEHWLISEYPFLPWREQLADMQKAKLKELGSRTRDKFELRLAVYHKGEFAGWSHGYQESAHTYYMANSAVSPALRRAGVYSELIKKTLDITREAGFQTVSSHHLLNNNAVIIAKLKMGFVIRGIELDPVHGLLLKLNYHHNELLNKAVRFRTGAVNEPEIKSLLGPDGPKPKITTRRS